MRLLSATHGGASNFTSEVALATIPAATLVGEARLTAVLLMTGLNTASCVRELRLYADGLTVNTSLGQAVVDNLEINRDEAAFAETHGQNAACLMRTIATGGAAMALDVRAISSNAGDTAVYWSLYIIGHSEPASQLSDFTSVDGSIAAAIDAINTAAAAIQAKTDTLPAAPAAQAKLDTLHDTRIPGVIQPQSGDSFARLGAPAGASVSADVAAVKTDTTTLLSRITASLFDGITSLAEWLGLIAGKQVGDATARTELRATGAGAGTFDETTDSLQALADAPVNVDEAAIATAVWAHTPTRSLTQTLAQLIDLLTADRLLIVTHYTWSTSLTGLGSLADADDLLLTVKADARQTDAQAAVQVRMTVGLEVIAGATAGDPALASITIDDADAGDVTIEIDEAATALLDEFRDGVWDLAVIRSTGAKQALQLGRAEVRRGVTRATS